MEKNKRLEFRTSEDFFDLVTYLSKKNGITKTEFITNKILNPNYTVVQIQERSDEEMEIYSEASNGMNQMARAINSLVNEYKLRENKRLSDYEEVFAELTVILEDIAKKMKSLDDREISLKSNGSMKHAYLNKIEYLDEDVVEYLERYRPEYLHDILNGEAEVK